MALPVFDKQEDIPEAFRDEYEERDGKWHPKDQGSGDIDELKKSVEKLEGSLSKEREERRAAEKKAKEAEDAKKAAELEAEAKSKGVTSEELEKIRKQAAEDYARENAEALKERETLAEENRRLKLDGAVKALAAENGVRAEKIDQWWRLNGHLFDLTDDGKPMVKDQRTRDVGKFIAEDVKKDVPEFYEGSKAKGDGAKGDFTGTEITADDVDFELIKTNPGAAMTAARAEKDS